MKSVPTLQQFIVQLSNRYGVAIDQTGAYLRLDLADERLVLENLGAERIRIACQLYLGHDWMSDPEIVLWTGATDAWTPIEVNQVQGGWQCYAEVDATGDLVDFTDDHGQAALADFAEAEVVPNLRLSGWLEREVAVTTQPLAYTWEDWLARGYVAQDPWLPEEANDVSF